MDLQDTFDRMARGETEPLHPDLQPHVKTLGSGMTFIKHPLVNELYNPVMNLMVNKTYLAKRAALEKAEAEGNWYVYVMFLIERPWRAETLLRLARRLTDEEYWHFVGAVWRDSENIVEWSSLARKLLLADRPGREHLMDEEERKEFAALPDTITIYRGYAHKTSRVGWSWTLDRDKAVWFAQRFASLGDITPRIAIATVKRADVLAYFTGRDESEIVIDPRRVHDVRSASV